MALVSLGPQNQEILGFSWDHLPLTVQFIQGPGVTDSRFSVLAKTTGFPMLQWNVCFQVYGPFAGSWVFGMDLLVDQPEIPSLPPDIIVELTGDVNREAKTDICVRLDPVTGFAQSCYIRIDDPKLLEDTSPIDPLYCAVSHALGHAMGLGHANHPDDIMHPDCALSVNVASNANAEGVALVFGWFDLGTSGPFGAPVLPIFRSIQVGGATADVYGLYPNKATLVAGLLTHVPGQNIDNILIENHTGDPVALGRGFRYYDTDPNPGISTAAIQYPMRTNATGNSIESIALPNVPSTYAVKIVADPVGVTGIVDDDLCTREVTYEYDTIYVLRRTVTDPCGFGR